MGKTSFKSIYQQSNKLEDQVPLLPFMREEERTSFVKKIQTLLEAARQAKQLTNSQQTKSRLQNIITTWEKFLIDMKYFTFRNLPVISKTDKTSLAVADFRGEEVSTTEFIHNFSSQVAHLVSQMFSPGKVDLSVPVSAPDDPELRAIHNELYGIVDAAGEKK